MTHTQYSDFLTQTALVWNWPIAIYLFLLGISVGMVTIAILLKRKYPTHDDANNTVIKATAIIAPISVVTGLLILVFHLTMPWTFWRLMIFYQPSSVMSLGVILFQIYMLMLLLWLMTIFQKPLITFLPIRFKNMALLINPLKAFKGVIENSLLIFAIFLGAYTGFLLSALKTYPMLNNPLLPILFLFSGISSGAATIIVCCVTLFKQSPESTELAYVHQLETPVAYFELILLFSFFVGLYFAGGQKTVAATTALFNSGWAYVFWIGIIGIGLLLPLLLNKVVAHHRQGVIGLAVMSLLGVLLLRLFILYAGQMTLA